MAYKSLNNQAPNHHTEMFVRLSHSRKRELRNTKTTLAVPHCKSAFGQKCFSHKLSYGLIFPFSFACYVIHNFSFNLFTLIVLSFNVLRLQFNSLVFQVQKLFDKGMTIKQLKYISMKP